MVRIPTIHPSRSGGLSAIVIEPITNLENRKSYQDVDSKDTVNVNLNTIIQAYRSGELEVIPGKISSWT